VQDDPLGRIHGAAILGAREPTGKPTGRRFSRIFTGANIRGPVPHYPILLDLEGRRCVVVGAGTVAARKVEALRRSGARVTVVGREAAAEIRELAAAGEIELRAREYRPGDVEGASLAIAATDDRAANAEVAADARARGVPTNVVDDPALCDWIAPAVLERGDLVVAVSTGGAAPALAGRVRDRIAEAIGPEYGPAVEILRRVRRRLRDSPVDPETRRSALAALAASELPELVRRGDAAGVDRLLGGVPGAATTLADLGLTLEGAVA
jgi:precorrin-2 dehydrogenase / sirohydrochlorin ferrochelatase